MDKKHMAIANFNITFGENEEPMLEHFNDIILPAFQSDIRRSKSDSEFIFMNSDIYKLDNEDFVFAGMFIKSTNLEILSKFDDNGELIYTNEYYPTAPYSIFIVYLKNHRVVFVKNQKGSPNINNFSSSVNYNLANYVKRENKERKRNNLPLLPYPMVNIIGIPMREDLKEALSGVKKIEKLVLRFYPLNGDWDMGVIVNDQMTDLRRLAGSNTGAIVLNSPTSLSGVIEIVEAAQGTVEPTFHVRYPNKSTATIKNDTLSQNREIAYNQKDFDDDIIAITEIANDISSIKAVSDGNRQLYNSFAKRLIED